MKIYLVRHPKKKDSDERPQEGDDSKKNNPSGDAKPAGDSKDNPTETAKPAEEQESKIRKGLDKVFWIRVGLGILAGTLSAEMGSSFQHMSYKAFVALGIMISLFIVSYAIAKALQVPLLPSDKKKLVMTGIGSYFLMFLFSWILVNTLIHPDVGIQSIR